MTVPGFPEPVRTDLDTGGHFDAAKRGELAVRRCDRCTTVLHLPRAWCWNCNGWDTSWVVVEPKGTLWSYTVTERAFRPGVDVPYTVVVVELDELPGVRFVGSLPGTPDLRIGQPMRGEGTDEGILTWRPLP